jgi:hypothetical protein
VRGRAEGTATVPTDWSTGTIPGPSDTAILGTNNTCTDFGSGRISDIATGASLGLRGSHTFVADSGQTTSNSALTGLAEVSSGGNLAFIDNVTHL